MAKRSYIRQVLPCLMILALLAGCQATRNEPPASSLSAPIAADTAPKRAEDLLIVDCLLPGQVRKLGSMTYLTPRRPVRTSARSCEIRGGEYVAFDRSDYRTALGVWMPSARAGDVVAQNYVGEIYLKGLGGAPQYTQAAAWFQKAADQGDTRALTNLGYLYENGLGVPGDPLKALNYYRKASGNTDPVILASQAADPMAESELKRLRGEMAKRNAENKALQRQLQRAGEEMKNARLMLENKLDAIRRKEVELKSSREEIRRLQRKQPLAPSNQAVVVDEKIRTKEAVLARQEAEAAGIERKIQSLKESHRQLSESALARQAQLERTLAAREQELSRRQREADALSETIQALTRQHQTLTESDRERQEQLEEKQTKQAARLTALNQKAAGLQEEIAILEKERLAVSQAQKQEQERLAMERAEDESTLLNYRREAAVLKQELERLRKERKTTAADRQQALEAYRRQVSGQEAILQQQREQAALLKEKIASLDAEAADYHKQINQYQKTVAQMPGPSIEIIDPRAVATRGGNYIPAKPGLSTRRIIGKLTAPAGIYSFRVNEKDQPFDAGGLFNIQVALHKSTEPTTISMVAVDTQGKRAAIRLKIDAEQTKAMETAKKKQARRLQFGKYHALIIGNNDYTSMNRLETPINDARAVARVLREKYGFETTVLTNANRFDTYAALEKYTRELKKTDNFLLYYAGHGELDRKNRRGYWLPINAEPGSYINAIPNFTVTDFLNTMAAKQVLVIADTCYSGILTRSAIPRPRTGMSEAERMAWLQSLAKERSRTVLSSGGLKPVLDTGYGDHSVFATAILEVLNNNADILAARQLHRTITALVSETSKRLGLEQKPQYAANLHAGHKAGDFLFIPRPLGADR